ncbi:MAG: T9SS type A sorting domain-containing protein [Bacteroidia bacterium]|nr:T9SS type A sorting domain-containing protein [Bacteroidia bacterium]
MKTHFVFLSLLVLISFVGYSQTTPYVCYGYDASGNRINRTIIIPPNPNGRHSNPADTTHIDTLATALQEQELQPVKETLSGGQTVSIYPNPTKGILVVEITNLQGAVASTVRPCSLPAGSVSASLQIFDLAGKLYYSKSNLTGREEIDFGDAPAGIYGLKISIDEKYTEWKIIKQ